MVFLATYFAVENDNLVAKAWNKQVLDGQLRRVRKFNCFG